MESVWKESDIFWSFGGWSPSALASSVGIVSALSITLVREHGKLEPA